MKLPLGLVLIMAVSAVTPSSTQECVSGNLTHCINESLSEAVNEAIRSGLSHNWTLGSEMSGDDDNSTAAVSPLTMTINDCAKILEGRLISFQDFSTKSNDIWNDIVSAQNTMVQVESSTRDILKAESQYGAQFSELNSLFQDASDRAGSLDEWTEGEKVIRGQLSQLYNALDTRVRGDGDEVVVTVSSIRDALNRMQVVHDHATRIMTAVGDAETMVYEWAYNVSQKINTHTINLVSIAQTLDFRNTQLKAVKDANVNIQWILSKLADSYGKDHLQALNAEYDSGSLSIPQSLGSGLPPTRATAPAVIPSIQATI
jgi:DNA-binding FrmR family transcriptional regulator